MIARLKNLATSCWGPVQQQYARMKKDPDVYHDGLMWCRDLVQHSSGEISMAVIQANASIEDKCHVEISPPGDFFGGTFIGIYDGHGGPEAAQYVCDNLYQHFERHLHDHGDTHVDAIERAIQATEDGFAALTRDKPELLTAGSCCLVGIIWGHALYLANLGDSRAVLASRRRFPGELAVIQLTSEDNVNRLEAREELRAMHPNDPSIVIQKGENFWKVKGIIQVSKSIGDFYLKTPGINIDALPQRFRPAEPLTEPALSAVPKVTTRTLLQHDEFLIFASDGLWEHLSNEEACAIVLKNPRLGIARRLIKAALRIAATKREIRYEDMMSIEKKVRRFFHDDITVVVVFVDHELIGRQRRNVSVSLVGGVDDR